MARTVRIDGADRIRLRLEAEAVTLDSGRFWVETRASANAVHLCDGSRPAPPSASASSSSGHVQLPARRQRRAHRPQPRPALHRACPGRGGTQMTVAMRAIRTVVALVNGPVLRATRRFAAVGIAWLIALSAGSARASTTFIVANTN